MADKNEIMIVDEQSLREKIYVVRGQQVMLDYDLAEIYGYTTKAFNQQVRRNIEKFDDDFMFLLTREDVDDLVRSQNVTSRTDNYFRVNREALAIFPMPLRRVGFICS